MFDTENSLSSFSADLSGDMAVLSVSEKGATAVPLKMSELQNSTFKATDDGSLLITTQAGDQVVVKGYFATVDHYITSSDGLALSSQIINTFSATDSAALTAAIGLAGNNNAIAIVDKVEGTAFAVLANGESITLKNGDKIPELAEIYTRSDASVDLVLKDGSLLNVGAQARLALDNLNFDPVSESGSMFIVVLRGIFSFASGLIARAEPDNVRLHTPTSEIGLRGTKIIGEVDAGGNTKVGLLEGRIVVYKDGQETSMDRPLTMASFFHGGGKPEVQQLNLQSFAAQFDDLSAREITEFYSKAEATAGSLPQTEQETFDDAGDSAGAEAATQRFGDIAGEISFGSSQEVIIPQNQIPEASVDATQGNKKASAPVSETAAATSTNNNEQGSDGENGNDDDATGPANAAPIARDDKISMQNGENFIQLFGDGITFSDSDSDTLQSIIITAPDPSIGRLSTIAGNGPNDIPSNNPMPTDSNSKTTIVVSGIDDADITNLVFVPRAGYHGTFTLEYQVTDSSDSVSNSYDLVVEVQGAGGNDKPMIQKITKSPLDRDGVDLSPEVFASYYTDDTGSVGITTFAPGDFITIVSIPQAGYLSYLENNVETFVRSHETTLSFSQWSSLTYKIKANGVGNNAGDPPGNAYNANGHVGFFEFKITKAGQQPTDSQRFEVNVPEASSSTSTYLQDTADGYQVVDDDHLIGSNLLSDSDL